MTGPTPGAAVEAVRDILQRLLSCVTADVLLADRFGARTTFTASALLRRTAGNTLHLTWIHDVATVSNAERTRRERSQAVTAAYAYTLKDSDGREIVAYHWHPQGRGHVRAPRLHLGAGLGTLRSEVTKAHLYTGMVTPVAILTLAVERFDVVPRRPDWAAIFERTERELTSP
jgi:hypothetical protein